MISQPSLCVMCWCVTDCCCTVLHQQQYMCYDMKLLCYVLCCTWLCSILHRSVNSAMCYFAVHNPCIPCSTPSPCIPLQALPHAHVFLRMQVCQRCKHTRLHHHCCRSASYCCFRDAAASFPSWSRLRLMTECPVCAGVCSCTKCLVKVGGWAPFLVSVTV